MENGISLCVCIRALTVLDVSELRVLELVFCCRDVAPLREKNPPELQMRIDVEVAWNAKQSRAKP